MTEMPPSATDPILLPRDDHVTNLIIKFAHEKMYHSGVQATLATLRLDYWIPAGRRVVRRIIRSCLQCKRAGEAAHFALPPMPPLPKERVNRTKLFQNTGLDYLGPLKMRSLNENKKEYHKVWVCLFTCFTTRLVHLELVLDMTAATFLNALRRFIARNGAPETIL